MRKLEKSNADSIDSVKDQTIEMVKGLERNDVVKVLIFMSGMDAGVKVLDKRKTCNSLSS